MYAHLDVRATTDSVFKLVTCVASSLSKISSRQCVLRAVVVGVIRLLERKCMMCGLSSDATDELGHGHLNVQLDQVGNQLDLKGCIRS